MKTASKSGGVASYLKSHFKKAKVVAGRSEFLKFNQPKAWVSTGLRHLDLALGGKGIPTGRIIVVSADASKGKTLLGLQISKSFQNYPKRPGMVHFIETEGTVDPDWIDKLGVDLSEDALVQPDIKCLEDLFEYVETSGLWHIKHEPNRPVLHYIDSITVCPPGKVLKASYGDSLKQKGAKAALISAFLEKMETPLKRSGNTLLFISQLRSRISINPMQPILGDPQTIAGGNSLGFYSSVHIRLKQVWGSEVFGYDDAKKRDRVYEQEGEQYEAAIIKSKISMPYRKAYLYHYFRETAEHSAGFDAMEGDLNWLVDRDLIFSYQGKDKAKTKAGFNEIHLDSGVYPFLGLVGWKQIQADPKIFDETWELMKANNNSRCRKDYEMEKSDGVSTKLDEEDVSKSIHSLEDLESDLDNLEEEAPDFAVK